MSKSFNDKDLQLFLGNLLRYGVLTALSVVLIGLFLFIFQQGSQPVHYATFVQEGFNFDSFFSGLRHGDSLSIMALGVLLLILTPVMRVISAIIGFLWEKDKLYALISSIVLLIIIFSTILGATAG
ncbi:MAG TPA: DUF1634 domain-containing protein [Edaphocola sp.]|nr:DUF1634 domain-containing protein [Edaphocola sp.]